MKKLFFLLIPAAFAFALVGCISNEDGGSSDDEDQRRPSDGAGYGGDATFIREQDPISKHQQHLRGNY